MAPPFKTCCVDIMYGEGVSINGEIVDLASDVGIIEKSGAWFSYNSDKIGQGKENAKIFLEANQDIYKEIEEKIKEKLAEEE